MTMNARLRSLRGPLQCLFGALILASPAVAAPRPLALEDYARMQAIAEPACSPDGRWVTYTVQSVDTEADEQRSRVWMVGMEGGEPLPLTAPERSAYAPRFSPDGRYVSFLATQGNEDKAQLFLLDRRGGEAQALAGIAGSIHDYAWSPDGRRLVLSIARDPQEGAAHGKAPAPIVIDALHFKEDRVGYLGEADRPQLYLYDLAARRLDALTTDRRWKDELPVFAPDGGAIAYISGHGDPDRTRKREIYLIEPRPGAEPRRVAEFFEPNTLALHFTPDGRGLVYTEGLEPRLEAYIEDKLALIDLGTRRSLTLATGLDRPLDLPAMLSSASLVAMVEDDGSQIAVKVPLAGGPVERLTEPKRVVSGLCAGAGRIAAVVSTDSSPPEIYALEAAGRLRKLSAHNDALMSELALGAVEDMSFASRDGTIIHGMIVKPPDYRPGQAYPTILWIHGGPNGGDAHRLSFDNYSPELDRQWFAAHGYVALAVNYRGSSGRGAAFARAIAADWGDKEVADLRAAVDYAVHAGIADPKRLGIGGWSYGGILTDYTIASDPRFKAAIAGAGSADQIGMYGSDEYLEQYNAELGPPWRATDRWLRVSYPFFHADRIHTPTLFMGGERDFNVPIGGGEQMYAALRTLGVPARLVIYPGQFHVFTRPSYIRDRLQRYLDWYDRHL